MGATNSNNFLVLTNNTTRMTVLASGDVGIGTTSPASKLAVSGTIHSTAGGFKFPDGTTQITAATAGGIAGPSFNVIRSANQTVSTSGWSKIQFNSEAFDNNNNFDSTTNYRFTPTVAGKYLFSLHTTCGDSTYCYAGIFRNGANQIQSTGAGGYGVSTIVLDMNGTTDYVEGFVFNVSGTNLTGGGSHTTFSGSLLAPLASGSVVAGTGTANYMPYWTNSTNLSNSPLAVSGSNIGLGTISPTARLQLTSGTSTANTAPLKLTSGTVMTTPEEGAIEFDGTNLFYTDKTATRKTLSTGGGTVSQVTSTNPFVSVATSTTTPAITIARASSTQDGFLASTDFSTFNNKLNNSLTSGTIWVGVAGTPTATTITGEATISNSGVLSLSTTGVASGTYRSVSVDAKGRVTAATNPTTITGYGITDAVINGGQAAAVSLGSTNANNLSFLTNNTTRMTVLASGDVGIGTASPAYKFQIVDSSSVVTGTDYMSSRATTYTPSAVADSSTGVKGDYVGVNATGSNNINGNITASQIDSYYNGSANLSFNFGQVITAQNNSTGGTSNTYAAYAMAVNNGSGSTPGLYGSYGQAINYNVGGSTTTAIGTYGQVVNYKASGTGIVNAYGAHNIAENVNSGNISSAIGSYNVAENDSSGTITTAFGMFGRVYNMGSGASSGAITTAFSSYIDLINNGNITNWYGLYIAPSTGTGVTTNRFPIYVDDPGSSYIKGNVGIGTTSPSQKLSVSGTIESTSGRFRFPDGTTQTTAVGVTGWQTVSSASVSAVSSHTFSSLTPGAEYEVRFNLLQNTTAGYLYIRFNSDSGTNYAWSQYVVTHTGSAGGTGGSSATEIRLDSYVTTTVGTPHKGTFSFASAPTSGTQVTLEGHGSHFRSDGYLQSYTHGGRYTGSSNLSSITVYTSAGTFTGTIYLVRLN